MSFWRTCIGFRRTNVSSNAYIWLHFNLCVLERWLSQVPAYFWPFLWGHLRFHSRHQMSVFQVPLMAAWVFVLFAAPVRAEWGDEMTEDGSKQEQTQSPLTRLSKRKCPKCYCSVFASYNEIEIVDPAPDPAAVGWSAPSPWPLLL